MNDYLQFAAAVSLVATMILGVFYAPFVTSIVTAGLLVGMLAILIPKQR